MSRRLAANARWAKIENEQCRNGDTSYFAGRWVNGVTMSYRNNPPDTCEVDVESGRADRVQVAKAGRTAAASL